MRLLWLRLSIVVASVWSGTAFAEETRLTVLHTTDLHGALTAYDYLADRPAARGLAKLATMVGRVRGEGHPVLLLDAGDCIQGSPLETVHREGNAGRPEPMMSAMNLMGYDAMAVGNHEFNFGLAALEKARADARFPWLAANVAKASDGKPAFIPSIVKVLGGIRVGVVGVCTPAVPAWEDSANIAGLRFESPVAAAEREVERLRTAERCEVVVIVAHTGLERDPRTGLERPGDTPDENWGYRLATQIHGADLLVLGHTHVVIPSQEIGGVLVTQAGKWGEHLGRVDLTLSRPASSDAWKVTARNATILGVEDSTPADSAVVALAAPYHDDTQSDLSEVIGQAVTEIGSPAGRFEDGPAWELIQSAQLQATGADVSLAALFDPEAKIAPGPVTVRDVMRLYVYDNTLATVEMTGAQLDQVLEHSARYLQEYQYEHGRALVASDMPGFNFDAAEGVSYEIDMTRPVGDRVVSLTFQGAPLAPDRKLKVAVNNYRLNGGGGFEAIRTAPRLSVGTRPVRDLLIDAIRRRGTLDGTFDRNWSLLPDYVAVPERPLIDLLVRQGVAPRAEVHRLYPHEPARRGDLAYWLARAFGWRERRLSGAYADVPDSLEPWLDGLVRRRILGEAGTHERFRPFAVAPLPLALDWCEAAARSQGYALPTGPGDRAFRLGLVTGVHFGSGVQSAFPHGDTLTRAQLLGIVANTRFPTLRVLETTDFHGAMLPGASERRTQRPWGGSAVLAAYINRLRAENPQGTLLVDGGDWFQGTMISNLAFGRPVVEQMNALGYTAAAIGNHEFDWSADTLRRRVEQLRCAALGANMRERRSGRMPSWVRSDTSVVRRGLRIGILGLCYPETPSVTLARHVAHLRFEDDSTTAARIVPGLRSRGRAHVVVGVGHIPGTQDTSGEVHGDLARLARVPGVDLWLGGHSHTQVAGDVGGVPALIAGSHGHMLAVADLVVDPVRSRVVEKRFRLERTYADAIRPDSSIQALVDRWDARVASIAAVPIGRNATRLTRTREGESTVGNLVTDAIRAAVSADIALQNNGGLRADLPEGTVTRGAIYEVMPFDNTIVTMELTGAEVRRVLEEGLQFERITQVSGIRYVFDLGRPEFSRVVSMTMPDSLPFDETRSYLVACNNFMADGGDGYETLSGGRNRRDTGILVRDKLEELVASRSRQADSLEYRLVGRITRLPGSPRPRRGD